MITFSIHIGDQSIADEFVSYAKSNKPSLLTQILAAIVLVKQYQRYDDAIELLTPDINMENHDELNLEFFSVIVQIYLLQDALPKAKNFLKKFSHLNINDSVVYNYSDALVSLVQGGSTEIPGILAEIKKTNSFSRVINGIVTSDIASRSQ